MTTRIDTRIEAQERTLAGTWQCRLDSNDVGVRDRWFVAPLGAGGDGEIELPGTTDLAGLGEPLLLEPELTNPILRGLHRNNRYIGPAWFQTEIDLTSHELAGRTRWWVQFERVLWESQVWLDGISLGHAQSLSTPHEFALPTDIRPGRHLLTVRVDNRPVCDVGGSHAYSEETQSIWNGLVGALRLRPTGTTRFERVRIVPNVESRRFMIDVEVDLQASATLTALARSPDGEHTFAASTRLVRDLLPVTGSSRTKTRLEIALGEDAQTWDEFTPARYDVRLSLTTNDGTDTSSAPMELDVRLLRVGLRSFVARGNELLINGRPVFLRGTLECCIFPDTGYPPCDLEPWRRIMSIAKSYGLNHLRFHSYCPPEAAFEAADEAGMYLQVELPNWSFKNVEAGSSTISYLEAEGRRILDAYANHPSFVLFSLGNELPGDFDALDGLLTRLRAHDNRPLYTSTSYSFSPRGQWPGPVDDFYVTQQTKLGWTRGQGFFNNECPTTDRDFGESVIGSPTPVITHEVGQYSIYPNITEIEHYQGPLRPLNFEAIKRDLESKGLSPDAAKFTAASGRWAAELYREDIERALRTPGLSGIQLLDLHDFPGQSTALVGLLDAFWRSKGIVEPEWFARFCAPTTLLLRLPRRVYESNEIIDAEIQLAHFGPGPIERGTVVDWSLIDDANESVASGAVTIDQTIETGTRPIVGRISVNADVAKNAARMKFELAIRGRDIWSAWNIWVFPKISEHSYPTETPVLIRTTLDSATRAQLEQGARVLLTPHASSIRHRIRGQFVPVFWSPLHFPMQPGTQGLLIDASHPSLADFPTDTHTDWQWWDLTRASTAAAIQDVSPSVRPIIQFIDHFGRNATPALVYEARVGKGKVLICTLDISSDLDTRPVARQLRNSLLRYASSASFEPEVEWNVGQLAAQFCQPSRMATARIIDASSHQPGCEPAFAIDGDTSSFWHSDWSAGHDYPHHLTIDLGADAPIEGVRLLPRQDGQQGGLIDAFTIELSSDGADWQSVAEGRFDGAKEHVVEFGSRYEGSRFVDGVRRARFLRVTAKSGLNGTRHASLAEISLVEASS